MLARVSDGPEEVENAPQNKMQKTENRPPNEGFPIHEDAKSPDNSLPTNDHDLRYARLLEAITKTALATREEIATRGDRIENQVGKLLSTSKSCKLPLTS